MTKEQIEKLCKIGIRKKFSAVQLSQYITQPPYNLSAVEATEVYYAFKNRYNGGTIDKPKTVFPRSHSVKLEASPVGGEVVIKISNDATGVEVKCIGAGGGGGNSNYTPSKLNRSSVKEYTLEVARQKRAGKWDRVGKSWTKSIEAELENVIRGIGGPADNDDIPGDWDFLNRKQIFAAVAEQLNRAVRRIILRKVRSYPTRGKTLK